MTASRQRLGDDPRDHDGTFLGFDERYQDVAGVRPDADLQNQIRTEPEKHFKPWEIYPKPPPPHWHWKGKKPEAPNDPVWNADSEFDFTHCYIPGPDCMDFKIDNAGVFQVYSSSSSESFGEF